VIWTVQTISMENERDRDDQADNNSRETESIGTNPLSIHRGEEEARIEAATHRFFQESKLKL